MSTLQPESFTTLPGNTSTTVPESVRADLLAVPAEGFWRSHGHLLNAQGYELVPLKRGTKLPAKRGWREDTYKNTDKPCSAGSTAAASA
jgi:hypothetical protein